MFVTQSKFAYLNWGRSTAIILFFLILYIYVIFEGLFRKCLLFRLVTSCFIIHYIYITQRCICSCIIVSILNTFCEFFYHFILLSRVKPIFFLLLIDTKPGHKNCVHTFIIDFKKECGNKKKIEYSTEKGQEDTLFLMILIRDHYYRTSLTTYHDATILFYRSIFYTNYLGIVIFLCA